VNTPSDPSRSTGKKKRGPLRRFLSLKRILLVFLGLFLVGATLFGVAYATVSIPQPNEMANAQASIIYYSDGKTEMGRISEVNRESVPLSKIPPHVQHALLAAEDRSFYQNNGISVPGIGRALVVALKGGPTQGGSTITQQYVKNYFLTQDRTFTRKAKEFIISIKIDQQESKSTILGNYLNTIYYGRGAYGIQTAAKAYFGHDASRLTVAEGALLASVIRGPAFYDPALGATQKAKAEARVSYVLDGMVANGWLTPEARAKTTFPKTVTKTRIKTAGTVGYIINEAKNELASKLHLTTSDIDRGGLRILTTIDKKAQSSAVDAVYDYAPDNDAAHCGRAASECLLHVGLTAIRPGDGAIVAMYGGKDFSTAPHNTSTQATMQGGSTFKVFGLLAALQKDISTKKAYTGYSPQYFSQFAGGNKPSGRVENFGGEQFGEISLRRALAHSVNTVFAQLNIDLADGGKTASGVKAAAILAGLPANTKGLGTNMTNIFGTASPHVIDMANAYATIAAKGTRATPYLISKVTSVDGNIDYKARKKLSSPFDKKVTADVTDAMKLVVTEGTAARNTQGLGRPAAGKTGTTTDNLAAWFDGFTPQLSAAVGIYQGDGTKSIKLQSGTELTGAGAPVKIWTAFMKGALEGTEVIDFPSREGVGDNLLPPPPPPVPSFTSTTPAPSSTEDTSTPTPRATTSRPEPSATEPSPEPTRTRPTQPDQDPDPDPTVPVPPTGLPPDPRPSNSQAPRPDPSRAEQGRTP
jgi:membrane peptidoglycan carboxypeptidase